MTRILITSGPTRQHLDPVRYLTNASSGRMGVAIAAAAMEAGYKVTVVTGPVDVEYPEGADVVQVVSTEDMLEACLQIFPTCDGMIGVAAPCDYRPVVVSSQKIRRTGEPLTLELVETPDVVALMGTIKEKQWMVGFALETEDERMRALQKLERKSCDLIVVNGPNSIHSADTDLEIINENGDMLESFSGDKIEAGRRIFRVITEQLVQQ